MTTRKPYHGQDGPVTFGRPTIGPRVYLVKGPSGWSETYDRKRADKALVDFVAPLEVNQLIDAFLASIRLARAETPRLVADWGDVVEYLAKITQQSTKTIPEIIAVAFWAQTILYEEQKETN